MKLRKILNEMMTSNYEVYRGISFDDWDDVDFDDLGTSWSLDSTFAIDRSEQMYRLKNHNNWAVFKIKITDSDIDWKFTIGQFKNSYWNREFEVIVKPNLSLTAIVYVDSNNDKDGQRVTINTGSTREDETMIQYNLDMGNFDNLIRDFKQQASEF